MIRKKETKKTKIVLAPSASRLFNLILMAQAALVEYFDSLSQAERAASGTFENWAPKDMLAHINYWRRRCVEVLAYCSRDQEPPEYPNYEEINSEVFKETQHLSLKALLDESEVVVTALKEVLARFEDKDFAPERYPWRKGQSISGYIIGQTYTHPFTHISNAYLKLGDSRAAARIMEQAARDISSLESDPKTRGLVIYDLACMYALAGNTEKAVENLREALTLRPDLIEWSQQDSDLDSLRAHPVYLQLIGKS